MNELLEKHVIMADDTICCIAAPNYSSYINCILVFKAAMILKASHVISAVKYIIYADS